MDTSTIVWIVVAVIVVLIIVAILGVLMSKKKKEQNRNQAGELRERAAAQDTGVQQREAEAKETEARARQARAEADQKSAEAERLEAHHTDRQSTAATYRDDRDENLRRADEVDPDAGSANRGDTNRGDTSRDSTRRASADERETTHSEGQPARTEDQLYDADGNPIGPDSSRTDPGSHRA